MKHYTRLLTFLFIATLFQSCGFEKPLNPQKAIITGVVSDFDKHDNKKWIEFVLPNLFSQKVPFKQIEIDSSGHFRYELEIVSPALCWGIYNKWFPFVISPGDSLYFSVDANIWSDSSPDNLDKGKYITISGSDNEDYKSVIAFQNWAADSIYTIEKSGERNKAIATNTSLEFTVYIQNREKEVLNQIKRFGTKEHAGKLYYKILEAEIKYKTLDDLMQYWLGNPYLNGKELKDSELPKEYFSFLKTYPMNNQDFFVEGKIGFIRSLQFYLQFANTAEREPFLDIRKHKEDAIINDGYFKNQAAYICKQTEGIARDLCLYFFALYNLDMVSSKSKEIYASVSELIKEPYVKEHFDKYFNSKFGKTEQSSEKINHKEYTALDSIISKYQGKVMYVDFWAPWCAPCMGEMKASKQLKESFKDKDVIFVYLACRCSVPSWKSAIANNDIDGINILLSDNDYTMLTHRFEFTSIPHFLLINKEGEVVNKNAPRPSDEKIKNEIMKLQ